MECSFPAYTRHHHSLSFVPSELQLSLQHLQCTRMPKNAHPPRGKPAKKTVPPEEDTSYIQFGDKKPRKKKPVDEDAAADSADTKGKGKATAEEGPKKPDTRTLIAGASWTGKLPVNLLSEHFQKQQWSKPDYRIVCVYNLSIINAY